MVWERSLQVQVLFIVQCLYFKILMEEAGCGGTHLQSQLPEAVGSKSQHVYVVSSRTAKDRLRDPVTDKQTINRILMRGWGHRSVRESFPSLCRPCHLLPCRVATTLENMLPSAWPSLFSYLVVGLKPDSKVLDYLQCLACYQIPFYSTYTVQVVELSGHNAKGRCIKDVMMCRA